MCNRTFETTGVAFELKATNAVHGTHKDGTNEHTPQGVFSSFLNTKTRIVDRHNLFLSSLRQRKHLRTTLASRKPRENCEQELNSRILSACLLPSCGEHFTSNMRWLFRYLSRDEIKMNIFNRFILCARKMEFLYSRVVRGTFVLKKWSIDNKSKNNDNKVIPIVVGITNDFSVLKKVVWQVRHIVFQWSSKTKIDYSLNFNSRTTWRFKMFLIPSFCNY